MNLRKFLGLGASACAFLVPVESKEDHKPLAQIAILLDTSNSMDGLIEQAKTQLWKIVNQFVVAKKDGQTPEVQVALFEYGNDRLSSGEGFLRMVLPLTTDLDRVSEELFSLRTLGGSEFCGQVIRAAASGLQWSDSREDLRVMLIAGNEPFNQGIVDFRAACVEAAAKGIIVNTIYCGPYEAGLRTSWKEGADLAAGIFLNIDQDAKSIHIAAPQDQEMERLGVQINITYVPYGSQGRAGLERQIAQDVNSGNSGPGSLSQRSIWKGSQNYRNVAWDLVDAIRDGHCMLESLKAVEFPEEMRGLSMAERKAYLEGKLKERERIQREILRLGREREKYLAEQLAKLGKLQENTLDAIVIKIIREQAIKKGYKFE